MQAVYMGSTIISTPDGFKIAGQNSTKLYPKTTEGLVALTNSIEKRNGQANG